MKRKQNSLAIFEHFKIRRHYDTKKEIWYFSVIDIVGALTDQAEYNRAKTYWTTLKNRLKNERSEVVTKCDRLKMLAHNQNTKQKLFDNAEYSNRFALSPFFEKKELGGISKKSKI